MPFIQTADRTSLFVTEWGQRPTGTSGSTDAWAVPPGAGPWRAAAALVCFP